MAPRIEYASAADGVSIAFWTLGDGPPFVSMPNVPWSNIEQEWRVPELHQWFQRVAEKRTVVRYDSRGPGCPTAMWTTTRLMRTSWTWKR